MQIGIEMTFPVVPQSPGIVLNSRDADACRIKQPLRIAVVEPRRVVEKLKDPVGQPEVFHDGFAKAARRRQRQHAV